LPVPFFWFLYDQQATKWVNQALAMNGRITDEHSVLPDQMQVVNALLILILIPVFQVISIVFYLLV
jgi:dipeptide/tripeptide permease